MLNQIVLVGRLVQDPEIKELENNKGFITLAVPRTYKNVNGEYDTDLIPVALFNGIAENTKAYRKKGDMVGVRGKIECENGKINLIAEKILFLSSRKESE